MLVNRKPKTSVEETPVETPVVNADCDVCELCVALKEYLQDNVKAGMQTHEIQDVLSDALLAIDGIDAAARSRRVDEATD